MSADEGPKDTNKKNVMLLSKKMEVLDKVDRGIRTAAVRCYYGIHESTICLI